MRKVTYENKNVAVATETICCEHGETLIGTFDKANELNYVEVTIIRNYYVKDQAPVGETKTLEFCYTHAPTMAEIVAAIKAAKK